MKVLREFDSVCRGGHYTYKLVDTGTEYQLQSYRLKRLVDSIAWERTGENLDLIEKACDTIELRQYD